MPRRSRSRRRLTSIDDAQGRYRERLRWVDHYAGSNRQRLTALDRLLDERGDAQVPSEVWRRLAFVAWRRLDAARPSLARHTLAEAIYVLSTASLPGSATPTGQAIWRPIVETIERRHISPREQQRPRAWRVPRVTLRLAYDMIVLNLSGVISVSLGKLCDSLMREFGARPAGADLLEQVTLQAKTVGVPAAAYVLVADLFGYEEHSVRSLLARR